MHCTFSVIIPCYNGFKYMTKCLEMLEIQTIKPYEIIIVNDCSKDDSFSKLEKYKNSSPLNIVLIDNDKNIGPGASRKKAIDIALGDYIAFCDCDDWVEPCFFETLSKESEDNPDVLIFDNYISYDNKRIIANTVTELGNGNKFKLLANIRMSLCRLVVKKEILQSVKFPSLYYGEDGAVVPQIIALAESIRIINKPLYNYYYHNNSVSQKPSPKAYIDLTEAFRVVKSELPQKYHVECEYIGIKYVCYGAVLSAFKAGIASKEIDGILNQFDMDFPNWTSNKYISNLGKIKNIYLYFINKRMFLLVKLMSFLHNFYIKFRRK